jgi:hypothetical protein
MNLRLGTIFLLLSLPCLHLGITHGSLPARVAGFYAAMSCLALSLGYWLKWPGLLLKRADGRLRPANYLVFAPYHLISQGVLRLHRALSRKPAWNEIMPGLYLGQRLLARDRPAWACARCAVLDLTAELAEVRWLRTSARYLCLPLLDRTAPDHDQLEQGLAFILESLATGGVYVHCAFGHSRSVLFVAAYLVRAGPCQTPEEALALIRSKRPGAYLNRAQWRCLTSFLRGPSSPVSAPAGR